MEAAEEYKESSAKSKEKQPCFQLCKQDQCFPDFPDKTRLGSR